MALGFPELFWSLRQWARRRRSNLWPQVVGNVEGYELLEARENGWLAVFYSYSVNGTENPGEFRKWLLFSFSSRDAQTDKVIAKYPRSTTVSVRFNPENPGCRCAGMLGGTLSLA